MANRALQVINEIVYSDNKDMRNREDDINGMVFRSMALYSHYIALSGLICYLWLTHYDGIK